MNKNEEKKLCRKVLAEVDEVIPANFANKVLAKYPDTPIHTLHNVRYGRTYKKDLLDRILDACEITYPITAA